MTAKEFANGLDKRFKSPSIELVQDAIDAVEPYTDTERDRIMEAILRAEHDYFPKKYAIIQAAREVVGAPDPGPVNYECQSCGIILDHEPALYAATVDGVMTRYRCPNCGNPKHWRVIIGKTIDYDSHNQAKGFTWTNPH